MFYAPRPLYRCCARHRDYCSYLFIVALVRACPYVTHALRGREEDRVSFFISHSVRRGHPSRTLQLFSTVTSGSNMPTAPLETTPRRPNDLYRTYSGERFGAAILRVRRPPARSGKSRGYWARAGPRELQTTKSALYRGQRRRRAQARLDQRRDQSDMCG
jgi:hypothetical protein